MKKRKRKLTPGVFSSVESMSKLQKGARANPGSKKPPTQDAAEAASLGSARRQGTVRRRRRRGAEGRAGAYGAVKAVFRGYAAGTDVGGKVCHAGVDGRPAHGFRVNIDCRYRL